MINHNMLQVGYEGQTTKTYVNDTYIAKVVKSGINASVFFQSPYYGNLNGSFTKNTMYDAAGEELNHEKRNSFSFSLRPSVGYFISDRLLLGGELNIYLSKDKNEYSSANDDEVNDISSAAVGLGPQVRYYFGPLKGKQLFHAGFSGGFNYNFMKQEYTDNGNSTVYKTNAPSFYANPYIGSSWFAGKHWTFAASLSYMMGFSQNKFVVANVETKNKATSTDVFLVGSVGYTF